jgi:RNA polymerase sigma-54 factor
MALSPRLHIKQTQSLVITPQLMQAIRLLQMSSLELVEFVDTELQQNPLLLRRDDTTFERDENPAAGDADPKMPDAGIVDLQGALRETTDSLTDAIDVSAADMFPDVGAPGEGRPEGTGNMDRDRAPRGAGGVSGRYAAASGNGMSGRHEDLPQSQSLVATIEAAISAAIRDPAMQMIAVTLRASLPARSRSAWRCSLPSATASIRPCGRCWTISACSRCGGSTSFAFVAASTGKTLMR